MLIKPERKLFSMFIMFIINQMGCRTQPSHPISSAALSFGHRQEVFAEVSAEMGEKAENYVVNNGMLLLLNGSMNHISFQLNGK